MPVPCRRGPSAAVAFPARGHVGLREGDELDELIAGTVRVRVADISDAVRGEARPHLEGIGLVGVGHRRAVVAGVVQTVAVFVVVPGVAHQLAAIWNRAAREPEHPQQSGLARKLVLPKP